MKILHISPMYYPALGGAEVHLKEVSEGLVSRGHDVIVVTANVSSHEHLWPGKHGKLPETEVINGVKIIRFSPCGGMGGAGVKNWQRIRGGYRSLSLIFGEDGLKFLNRKPSFFPVIPYLLSSPVDIAASMNWHWPPAYYVYLARKIKRFTLVGIPLFHTAEGWCEYSVYKRMLANCDAVVANTAYEAEFVEQRAHTRVEIIGVGIHPRPFEYRNGKEIRARYRLGSSPVVGFVGRQAANKGAIAVIQAMKIIWKWNSEVRLVLAGPRSYSHNKIEGLLQEMSERERARIITIHDFPEEDKPSIYDSFDVFALPSVAESFGIAYLEAWLCRKPVIGGRIGPTQCVINEGVDGLLADPNDPADIARTIIELLSDEEKRQRMGENGYTKTISHFTWDKVTDRIEKLYLDLRQSHTR